MKVSIVGSLRDREVACSASDRQGSNFESCVWRTVSSQLSHHPQEVLLAQFSLYVHKGGLKPDSLHFFYLPERANKRKQHPNFKNCVEQLGEFRIISKRESIRPDVNSPLSVDIHYQKKTCIYIVDCNLFTYFSSFFYFPTLSIV